MPDEHGLNDRQRKFCENVVLGMSQAEAYRKAGYESEQPWRDASELVKVPKVSDYIAKLREESREQAKFTRERALEVLKEVAEYGDSGSSRVAAVAQAARMEGWNASEKVEVSADDTLAAALAGIRKGEKES